MAFSAVASKKVSRKAVARNRNKRRLREIFRKLAPTLPAGEYILFIKKDLSDMSYPALFEAASNILNKAA